MEEITQETLQMPPLLNSMTNRKCDITLYYKEKVVNNVPEINGSNIRRHHSIENSYGEKDDEEDIDLDLTGSPLKAGFDVNQVWNTSSSDFNIDINLGKVKSVQPIYRGVRLSKARKLLSEEANNLLDTWVITDCKDPDKTLYLGSKKNDKIHTLSKVTWSDFSSHRHVSTQLEPLLKKHQMVTGSNKNIKTSVTAEYCLTNADNTSDNFLSLVSSWCGKINSLLETPPLDAITRLKARIVPGDEQLVTSSLWKELLLLDGFIKGLEEGKEVTWVVGEENQSMDVMISEMMEEVRLSGPRSGLTKLESDSLIEQGQDYDSLETINLEARQDFDFTDRLWSVLSKSQSYQELTEGFRNVFSTIKREEIRPFIYSQNKTSVVSKVGELVRGAETLPSFHGAIPLKMLIECGMEKLRRDYSHTLLNSELASKETVSQFLTADTLENSVELLYKLHLVVELTALSQTFLTLPQDSLRHLVQVTLSQFSESSWDHSSSSFDFDIPVPTISLKDQLTKLKPNVWQVSLESAGSNNAHFLGLATVARLMIDTPIELTEHIVPTKTDEEDKSADPEYVMIELTEVQRTIIEKVKGI